MMKRLQGRNLKHPGCLIGITLGVTLGIIIAGVQAAVFHVALNTVLWTWLALILVLGALGWIIGDRLSSRFPGEESLADMHTAVPSTDNLTSPPQSTISDHPAS